MKQTYLTIAITTTALACAQPSVSPPDRPTNSSEAYPRMEWERAKALIIEGKLGSIITSSVTIIELVDGRSFVLENTTENLIDFIDKHAPNRKSISIVCVYPSPGVIIPKR
ncbi:MAG: hypothetical protein IPL96_04045 [Holophagaceae bacterium]|nr:hypothetical protein [Holophagaceae bacterium]